MEALSFLIARAIEGDFLSSCKIGGRVGEGLVISHLLYVDDSLLFYDSNYDQLAYLSWLLMWFEAILRLKINLSKSEIILVESCKCGGSPLIWVVRLGIFPLIWDLGALHKSMVLWVNMEMFRKRLTLWKRQYNSKAERLALLRSTLSSLPIYFMVVSSTKAG